MTISTWMPTLKANMAAVSGILEVRDYNDLPGSLIPGPTMVILPRSGDMTFSMGGPCLSYHRVELVLYTAANVLPESYKSCIGFIHLVRNAIAADLTLGGTVKEVTPDTPFYETGAVPYGDKELIGVIFRVTVTEDETGSVTVSA
jgi:hypothetical protein